jgi:glycosyltransferase involved in cell wall biosynthesis
MKDVECLLDAFHALVAADPGFEPELLIAGEGSLGDALRARASRGPAADRVRFLGRVSHGETLRLVAAARLLVLPSRCSEGCPNVILEAMALGTPVVVSDLPSLREMVDHGVDGSVFAIGDREQLRARLAELAADPELRAALAAGGRARVRARHRDAVVAAHYAEVYARVLADDGRHDG